MEKCICRPISERPANLGCGVGNVDNITWAKIAYVLRILGTRRTNVYEDIP
jgi:hypothetical protein